MRNIFQQRNILSMTLAIFVAVGMFVLPVHGAFNPQINYQAKLGDGTGATIADGVYHMVFRLYDASTGGTLLWQGDRSTEVGNRVTVQNGLFSILLGSSTPLTAVNFNQDLYLEVKIGGTASSTWETLSPRKQLGAVPAAFEADKLDGIDSTQFVRNDAVNTVSASDVSSLFTINQTGAGNVFDLQSGGASVFTVLSTGNVGIGTTSPTYKLSVEGTSSLGNQALAGYFTATSTSATSTLPRINITSALTLGSDYVTDITGTGLSAVGGVLSVTAGAGSYWTDAGAYVYPTAGQYASAPYFVATSTTATSTFNGGVALNGFCVVGETRIRRRKKKQTKSSGNGDDDEEPSFAKATADKDEWEDVLITDLDEGDEVASLDQEKNEIVYKKVLTILETGVRPVVTLALADGRSISTTVEHPYLKKVTGEISDGEWTKVERLKVGDSIAVVSRESGLPQNMSCSQTEVLAGRAEWQEIVALKQGKAEPVYDLEIEDTHNFIGNDIVAHNTLVASKLQASYLEATSTTATSTLHDSSIIGRLAVAQTGTNAVIIGDTTGNARGTNALDVQSGRSAVTQVAIGNCSVAFGYGNTATGPRSTASGYINTASGFYTTALGYINTASVSHASALGSSNTASGSCSSAFGYKNTASAVNSQMFGRQNFSGTGGLASVGLGILNNSTGGTLNTTTGLITGTVTACTTIGRLTTTVGIQNTASGNYAQVFGFNNLASAASTTAIGMNLTNDIANSAMFGPSDTAKLTILSTGETQAPYFTATSTTATSTLHDSSIIGRLAVAQTGTNAVIIGDTTGNARGTNALDVQSGRSAVTQVASGICSSAVGFGNTASGCYSSAVGFSNTASGCRSSASGSYSSASGCRSSALGYGNTASHFGTSALGYGNIASGYGTSASGYGNTASGVRSATFGYGNTASGSYSSALGYQNKACTLNSSVFGNRNFTGTSGLASVGIGILNNQTGATLNYVTGAITGTAASAATVGRLSSAVGLLNTASGDYAQVFGFNNIASVASTTVIGMNITNSIANSAMFGPSDTAKLTILSTGETQAPYFTATSTTATSTLHDTSIIGRLSVLQTGTNAVIIGDTTGNARGSFAFDAQSGRSAVTQVASGICSSAVGLGNTASGYGSSALGSSNTASGYFSSAFGFQNTASGVYRSSAFGYSNTASGSYSSALGYSNTASGIRYSSAVGSCNTASGWYSSAIGFGNTASYDCSTAMGYTNTASGNYSSAFGFQNTASGIRYSSAFGSSNTASGCYASALGYVNTASGNNSFAFGSINTASGNYSSAFGSINTASGNYSSALGYSNKVYTLNSSVFGNRNFTGTGGFAGIALGTLNNQTGATLNYATGAITGTATSTVTVGRLSSAVGLLNTASGNYAQVFGFNNLASAASTTAIGMNITNSIANSAMFGPSDTAKLTILSTGETQAPYFTATSTTATSTFPNLAVNNLGICTGGTITVGSDTLLSSAGDIYATVLPLQDTASNLSAIVPQSGQRVYETDTGYTKVGDGTTATASLPPIGAWKLSAGELYYKAGVAAPYFNATSTTATSTLHNSSIIGRLSVQQTGTNAVIIGDTTGNARGTGALDVQSGRSAVTQVASGLCSSAFGYANTASGDGSSALGYSNTASGYFSSALGRSNTASGCYSSASGYNNTTSGAHSSAFGYNNNASGYSSSALGYANTASGYRSSAFGFNNKVYALNSSVFGNQNFTGTGGLASVALGTLNNQTGATLNYVTGAVTGTATSTATVGRLSSAVGLLNTASGNYSQVFGFNNLASAASTTAIGMNLTNSIANSAMFGASDTAKLTILSTGETQAPYFTATSTTATSTFAGNLSVDGDLNFNGSFFQNGSAFVGSQWTTTGSDIYYSTGNVGLGTTTPTYKLSVEGSSTLGNQALAGYFSATSTTATSTFAGGLSVGNGALRYDYGSGKTTIENLNLGALGFDTDAGVVSWIDLPVTSAATVGTVQSYSAQIDSNPILTIYSTSDGAGSIANKRVGIASSTPYASLSVWGAGTGTGNLFELTNNASTTVARVQDNGTTYLLGNVGLGTTTPTYKLSVEGSSTLGNQALAGYFTATSTTATSTFNFIDVVGTGANATSTIASNLWVQGNLRATVSYTGDLVFANDFRFTEDDLASPIQKLFLKNQHGTNLLTVSDKGSVGIGTTTPSGMLSLAQQTNVATSGLWIAATDGDYRSIYMDTSNVLNFGGSANTATLNSAGEWTNASDQAYKDTISDLNYGLAEIMELRPTRYTIKGTDNERIGFIAQEMEQILPELVSGVDGSKGISYGNLTAVIVKAVKELSAKIDNLGGKVVNGIAYINSIVADRVQTKELCLDDVCIDKDQLQAMLAQAGLSAGADQTASGGSSSASPSSSSTDVTAPVITLSGENPVHVALNVEYRDPGASVQDNIDTVPVLKAYVDDVEATDLNLIRVGTGTSTIHIVKFVATDTAGNRSEATRTIYVGTATAPVAPIDTGTSTSTPPTSTTTPVTSTDTASSTPQLTIDPTSDAITSGDTMESATTTTDTETSTTTSNTNL